MHTLSSFTLSFFFPNKEMVIVLTLQEYAETDNVTDVLILRIVHAFLLYSLNMENYITDFLMLKQFCLPGANPNWSWYITVG